LIILLIKHKKITLLFVGLRWSSVPQRVNQPMETKRSWWNWLF